MKRQKTYRESWENKSATHREHQYSQERVDTDDESNDENVITSDEEKIDNTDHYTDTHDLTNTSNERLYEPENDNNYIKPNMKNRYNSSYSDLRFTRDPSKASATAPKIEVKSNIMFYTILGLIVLIIGISVFPPLHNSVFSLHNSASCNEKTLETIKRDFPSQPIEMLENVEAIIDDVLKIEPIHPAVFLFLFDEKTENNNFISAIAEFASHKHCVNGNHIVLDETEYAKPNIKNDYGHLIAKYKPLLEERKVMVIKNLHKMPGKTAQALHSFCDEITPLVDRAVYILTLKVDSFSGNEVHTAEKQLYKNWNDLDNDILAPLVTRVTSTVIKIH